MLKNVAIVAGFALAASAHGQFYAGFELPDYNASAAGTPVTGQQGWYQPVVGGADGNVYTYSGNALGLVQNPVGGNQFLGGTSGGGTLFPRAQRDMNFGPGTWTAAYDMAGDFLGTAPATQFLSSFSLQDSTTARSFIAVNAWDDLANPSAGYSAQFNVFNAAGGALNNQSPGSFWEGLDLNHWYRQYITFDFNSNRILEVTLVDLHTGRSASAQPTDWYMTGGASPTQPLPTGFRFFVGGSVAGNTMGFDNIWIVPTPGTAALLGLGGLLALRRRR
jgi:hypothetical protein